MGAVDGLLLRLRLRLALWLELHALLLLSEWRVRRLARHG